MDNGYQVVDLTRISRKWADVTVTATNPDGTVATVTGVDFALLPYRATPQTGTVWSPASTFANDVAQVLLAGPDASTAGALVAQEGTSDLWARVVDAQEVDVKMVARIRVQ